MIDAEVFVAAARDRGLGLYSGVPCSYLKPFINSVIDSDGLRYIAAANEGDAVAIAAGAELGGTRGVAIFQNSGLGNAVNPLTSLTDTFRIPILVITTLRGDPEAAPDEPQHARMGSITTGMLDLMGISWEFFPRSNEAVPAALDRALAFMDGQRRPFAFVMRKDSAAPVALQTRPASRAVAPPRGEGAPSPRAQRWQMLEAVGAQLDDRDVVIATTGYTGRELYALGDRDNHFYMVGSMGCASSFGLGMACAQPGRRILVLDGDGAALMRLGAMATIGAERPTNLLHVLLDNGAYESTGGQSTVASSIDFPGIAWACGYPAVAVASAPDELAAAVSRRDPGLRFVHAPILPGVREALPRPAITPPEVAQRLRAHLAGRP